MGKVTKEKNSISRTNSLGASSDLKVSE